MSRTTDTILTRTITPGKGGTRVQRVKYEATKKALLKVIPRSRDGIAFSELPKLIKPLLPKEMLPAGGSTSWLVTVVKLDLEARGLLVRIPGPGPQRIRQK